VNFGPLAPEITRLMFTHSRSTVRVLRTLMHLSVGHVTLLLEKFHPHKFRSPPIGLRAPGGLTLGFAPNFYFFSLCVCVIIVCCVFTGFEPATNDK